MNELEFVKIFFDKLNDKEKKILLDYIEEKEKATSEDPAEIREKILERLLSKKK